MRDTDPNGSQVGSDFSDDPILADVLMQWAVLPSETRKAIHDLALTGSKPPTGEITQLSNQGR